MPRTEVVGGLGREASVNGLGTLQIVGVGGLGLMLFVIPIEGLFSMEGLGSSTRVLGMVVAPIALLGFQELGFRVSANSSVGLLYVFACWVILSTWWVAELDVGLRGMIGFGELVLWGCLLGIYSQQVGVRSWFGGAYVMGCIVSSVILIAYHIQGVAFSGGRLHSFEAGPNATAFHLALGLPLAWHLAIESQSMRSKLWWTGYLGMGVLAIGLTGSRGGALAAMVGLIVAWIGFGRRGTSFRSGLASLGLLTGVGIALWQLPARLSERILWFQGGQAADDLAVSRLEIYRSALRLINQHIVLGVGWSGGREAIWRESGRSVWPHNGFLEIPLELGLIGAGMFLWLLLSVVARVWRWGFEYRGVWIACLAVCFAFAMTNDLVRRKAFWFVLGVGLFCGTRGFQMERRGSLLGGLESTRSVQ